MRRYSSIAMFSDDLQRIVLIHKQKPDWQAGLANVIGGKVEPDDYLDAHGTMTCDHNLAHVRCAKRETKEETGIVVSFDLIKHFCDIRFRNDNKYSECRLYCSIADIDKARTVETERVFISNVSDVSTGTVKYILKWRPSEGKAISPIYETIPTLPNLPWLVAMAKQCMCGEDKLTWPVIVNYKE